MNILIDSHVLIWLANPPKSSSIGKEAQRLLEKADAVYFSSISIAELSIKAAIGKLKLDTDRLRLTSRENGLLALEFSDKHAVAVGSFASLTRHDPFDRMLMAQAQAEGLVFLTADSVLLGLGLAFVQDVTQ